MRYKERFKEIVDLLQTEQRVLVGDLSKRFGLSEVTIRKDLDRLEKMGVVRRFHSGAVAIENSVFDIPVKQKLTENRELKLQIARAAAAMVDSGVSLIIDAGSTAHQIARILRERSGLQIVTNSLMAGGELAEVRGIELLLTGGSLRPESQAMVGPVALETLGKIHVDIAFVGAMGVSLERGFTSATFLEAQTKEAMLRAARHKVVVADHTKFGTDSFAPFSSLDGVDVLVTDERAPEHYVTKLRETGLQVVVGDRKGEICRMSRS